MNKVKQNKITFSLILLSIVVTFSSLTVLSLPVLFNYESKVTQIEKNFYKNFKIYLNTSGKVSYKPFPKPHLLVENASISLEPDKKKDDLIVTSNLKIYISLRDLYLRSFNNFISAEISNSNLNIKISDLKDIRNHLYKMVNKQIILNNCKLFIRNSSGEVVLISPLKKVNYLINNKTKIKIFKIDAKIFGLNFVSEWKRSYENSNISSLNINLANPTIEIKNIFKFDKNNFDGQVEIDYLQDKLKYNIDFYEDLINISSPNKENTNFNIEGLIQLKPFYSEVELTIKERKIQNIIDNILVHLLLYDENYLGNINGILKIKFNELSNKLIKSGEINFTIKEKQINLERATFNLEKIGSINTEISFAERQGDIIFLSKNHLKIENHIEFAKTFQVGTKKIKNIENIYFDIEKNIGKNDFTLSNVKLNNLENDEKTKEIFMVENIQNLRLIIRKLID